MQCINITVEIKLLAPLSCNHATDRQCVIDFPISSWYDSRTFAHLGSLDPSQTSKNIRGLMKCCVIFFLPVCYGLLVCYVLRKRDGATVSAILHLASTCSLCTVTIGKLEPVWLRMGWKTFSIQTAFMFRCSRNTILLIVSN